MNIYLEIPKIVIVTAMFLIPFCVLAQDPHPSDSTQDQEEVGQIYVGPSKKDSLATKEVEVRRSVFHSKRFIHRIYTGRRQNRFLSTRMSSRGEFSGLVPLLLEKMAKNELSGRYHRDYSKVYPYRNFIRDIFLLDDLEQALGEEVWDITQVDWRKLSYCMDLIGTEGFDSEKSRSFVDIHALRLNWYDPKESNLIYGVIVFKYEDLIPMLENIENSKGWNARELLENRRYDFLYFPPEKDKALTLDLPTQK